MKIEKTIFLCAAFSIFGALIGWTACKKTIMAMVNDEEFVKKVLSSYPKKESTQSAEKIEGVLFYCYEEAENTLLDLVNMIEKKRYATVADLCDLCGIEKHEDYCIFGWENLNGSIIKKIDDEHYKLTLPSVKRI